MARPKSLVKNVQVTKARREHGCKSNKKHRIFKGDLRVTVKEGQSERNYCLECGRRFVETAIDELSKLRDSLP